MAVHCRLSSYLPICTLPSWKDLISTAIGYNRDISRGFFTEARDMTANNHVSSGTPPTASDRSTLLETEILPQDCVLIIGGGPVGLCLSVTLAHFGVKSVVVERNETTTR